ncbi:hypothetical protein HBA55_16945 [Pseudomaricurvus alkylphenolicus]|jgi:hypothetical protein|uniref:hypothetical protein n=1 Tax=Pseudomaricurvus alkylphenolicus TaxID=1306991 RepID=UPI0014229D19|nr:hypothetical protein [Pseudomaricurvus alkylphenolicus]NIB41292.1 hypothetical protein [Pseudomaricurvus alkylphenolicus]
MWLTILIVGCAVALLLGPIMLMQPTAGQRRQAALRQCAADNGLRVHLQPPPEGADGTEKLNSSAMYCLPWKRAKDARNVWVLVRRAYEHELHAFGRWDWQGEGAGSVSMAMMADRLKRLPAPVFAVASGPQGLCCYWSELGDEAVVRELAQWLQQTAGALVDSSDQDD